MMKNVNMTFIGGEGELKITYNNGYRIYVDIMTGGKLSSI